MYQPISAVLPLYVAGAIWYLVTLAVALLLVEPMQPLYAAVGTNLLASTLGTMGIAMAVATGVASIVWVGLRRRRRSTGPASHE